MVMVMVMVITLKMMLTIRSGDIKLMTMRAKSPGINEGFSVDSCFSLKEFVKLVLDIARYWIPGDNGHDGDHGDDNQISH